MSARLEISPDPTGGARAQAHLQQNPAPCNLGGVTKPGDRRSRSLLLLERTMYRDGLTPFTSVFTASLRGDLNELKLRQAFAHMQGKHPLLRCRVDQTADGPRFVEQSQPAPVPLRIVDRNGAFDWEQEARHEWITPFSAPQDPLVRLVWLRGDGIHELMLVAHHCLCDGRSGMTLLRDMFAAYDDPQRNARAYDSLGAIEDLVPGKLLRDCKFRLRARRRAALLKLALMAKVRRRSRGGSCPSTDQMYFHRWQLHAMDAEALTQRCREENVTVLAAVGVAMLRAFREIRGAGALKHAYTMVNARRFLPQLHPDALFGIAPGVEIPIRALVSANGISTSAFWEHARTFRNDLKARMDRLGSRFYEDLAALESFHHRYARLIADTDAAPSVRHITFSNVGRLDLSQQYRDFRVEHVYSPLVMVSPSPANTVVLSSFGGVMELAIISDEQSLAKADTAAIQQRTMAILRACAGLAPHDEVNTDPTCVERALTR